MPHTNTTFNDTFDDAEFESKLNNQTFYFFNPKQHPQHHIQPGDIFRINQHTFIFVEIINTRQILVFDPITFATHHKLAKLTLHPQISHNHITTLHLHKYSLTFPNKEYQDTTLANILLQFTLTLSQSSRFKHPLQLHIQNQPKTIKNKTSVTNSNKFTPELITALGTYLRQTKHPIQAKFYTYNIILTLFQLTLFQYTYFHYLIHDQLIKTCQTFSIKLDLQFHISNPCQKIIRKTNKQLQLILPLNSKVNTNLDIFDSINLVELGKLKKE